MPVGQIHQGLTRLLDPAIEALKPLAGIIEGCATTMKVLQTHKRLMVRANPTLESPSGDTPAHSAARVGSASCLEILVQNLVAELYVKLYHFTRKARITY